MFDEVCEIIRELLPEPSRMMRYYMATLRERRGRDDPYPMDSQALKDWHARMMDAYNDLSSEEKRIDQQAFRAQASRSFERENAARGG